VSTASHASTGTTDKTALVTGGIGKAIAIGLARAECQVLIVGLDAEKGARAESDAAGERRTPRSPISALCATHDASPRTWRSDARRCHIWCTAPAS